MNGGKLKHLKNKGYQVLGKSGGQSKVQHAEKLFVVLVFLFPLNHFTD